MPRRSAREIGAIIREHRKVHLMLNQEQLGKKVGLGVSAISRIEKGAMQITADRLIAICEALSLSADYLLWKCGETDALGSNR